MKFSTISRKFITTITSSQLHSMLCRGSILLKTMTIKFRKPRKLGVVSESWLRQELLTIE